jgi:superfamily I DNA/RNA helicase
MERLQAAAQQQDPNNMLLQAAAEEALAKAAKARADVIKTGTESELTQAKTAEIMVKIGGEAEGAMQPQSTPEPAAPQIDPFEAAKRELELENMRMDNAAKFASLAKALKQQQAEEESGSEEESESDESDDKVSETLGELKSMVESLARQVADMRPQQPIIVSTGGGGKKIQITKTSTGFSGEVVNEE